MAAYIVVGKTSCFIDLHLWIEWQFVINYGLVDRYWTDNGHNWTARDTQTDINLHYGMSIYSPLGLRTGRRFGNASRRKLGKRNESHDHTVWSRDWLMTFWGARDMHGHVVWYFVESFTEYVERYILWMSEWMNEWKIFGGVHCFASSDYFGLGTTWANWKVFGWSTLSELSIHPRIVLGIQLRGLSVVSSKV